MMSEVFKVVAALGRIAGLELGLVVPDVVVSEGAEAGRMECRHCVVPHMVVGHQGMAEDDQWLGLVTLMLAKEAYRVNRDGLTLHTWSSVKVNGTAIGESLKRTPRHLVFQHIFSS